MSSVSMKDHVPQFAFSLDDRILNSDRSHCFSFPASGFLFGRIICNDRAEGEAPALNAFNLSKTCSLDKLPSKLPSNAAISRRTSGSFDRAIRTARAASTISIRKSCFIITHGETATSSSSCNNASPLTGNAREGKIRAPLSRIAWEDIRARAAQSHRRFGLRDSA